jgi:hypothetical protein
MIILASLALRNRAQTTRVGLLKLVHLSDRCGWYPLKDGKPGKGYLVRTF